MLIEVPHFASLRGNERETTILLSDDGRTWREHVAVATEDDVSNVLQALIDGEIQIKLLECYYSFSVRYFRVYAGQAFSP